MDPVEQRTQEPVASDTSKLRVCHVPMLGADPVARVVL